MSEQILFPVGRMIAGNAYRGIPRESNGEPVFVRGSNPPVQALEYKLALAIAKENETDWKQTEWGAKIVAQGREGFPQQYLSQAFAWKIIDGDSNLPNTVGKIPREQPHQAGHWIIWMSSWNPPQLCNTRGQPLFEADAIYPGCYIQVVALVKPNGAVAPNKPGIFIDQKAICFIGHGERIESGGINTTAIKWSDALPPGASATPVGAAAPAVEPVAPAVEPVVNAIVSPPPNYAVLQPPAPVKIMKGSAAGFTYEQMIAAGWTDEQLIASGMM